MTLVASCHCGATRIELPQPTQVRTCNCSFCSRIGAIWAYYKPGEIRFISQEGEATYDPRGMNRHHFCSHCGMHTWGDSPDWAAMYNADGTPKDGDPTAMPAERIYQVNLRLVDGFDFSTVTIEELDGRNSW